MMILQRVAGRGVKKKKKPEKRTKMAGAITTVTATRRLGMPGVSMEKRRLFVTVNVTVKLEPRCLSLEKTA